MIVGADEPEFLDGSFETTQSREAVTWIDTLHPEHPGGMLGYDFLYLLGGQLPHPVVVPIRPHLERRDDDAVDARCVEDFNEFVGLVAPHSLMKIQPLHHVRQLRVVVVEVVQRWWSEEVHPNVSNRFHCYLLWRLSFAGP